MAVSFAKLLYGQEETYPWALIISGLLVLSLCLPFLISSSKRHGERRPPIAPYWIPYFGHLFSFIRNPGALVRSLETQFSRSPFTLIMMGTEFHVFSSPNIVSAVFSRSREFLFHPVVASMMKNGIELPEMDQPKFEVLIAEYSSNQKESREFVEANHAVYIKYLSGRNLEATMTVYNKNLNEVLDKLLPSTKQEINLHEELQKIVFFTSLTTFFGKRLQPTYPQIWGDYKLINEALYVGVRSNLVFTLFPRYQRARTRLLRAFDKWLDVDLDWNDTKNIWNEKWGLKLNWDREMLLQRHGFSLRGRSCSHASFLWVIITNAAPMTTWFLINIIQSPYLLERFRKDVKQSISSGDPFQIDISRLKTRPFVQGLWKEALRLGSASAAARVISKDVQLEGYSLKQGSVILLPVQLLHFNANVFKDPESFNPDRWIFTHPDDPESVHKQKLQNANLRPFGGGSGICSGRFVAEEEAILLAAILVMRFDFDLIMKDRIQLNPRSLGIMSPQSDIIVKLKLRDSLNVE